MRATLALWLSAALTGGCDDPLVLERPPAREGLPPSGEVVAALACPAGSVLIAAASFVLGSATADGEDDEHPGRRVSLPGFCLSRLETTVDDYRACVAAGVCSEADSDRARNCNAGHTDRGAHPINCLDWEQARRYCSFAGGRLPGEPEWELAARGIAGRRYPWGDAPPDATRLNSCGAECRRQHPDKAAAMYAGDDGHPKTAPVGSYPAGATPEGVLDMAGNVWEWTADAHLPYAGDATSPVEREVARRKVVRGGGWFHHLFERVRAANRHSYPPTERNGHLGVRCVIEP